MYGSSDPTGALDGINRYHHLGGHHPALSSFRSTDLQQATIEPRGKLHNLVRFHIPLMKICKSKPHLANMHCDPYFDNKGLQFTESRASCIQTCKSGSVASTALPVTHAPGTPRHVPLHW